MLSRETSTSTREDSDNNWSDALEYNSKTIYEGDVDNIISNDVMRTIRAQLCDANAQKIFDILSQTGDTWEEYSQKWGTRTACKAHMAKFLNVTSQKIEEHKRHIMAFCVLHGLK